MWRFLSGLAVVIVSLVGLAVIGLLLCGGCIDLSDV